MQFGGNIVKFYSLGIFRPYGISVPYGFMTMNIFDKSKDSFEASKIVAKPSNVIN